MVIVKSLVIAACVITSDRFIRGLGPARLGLDLALYVVLALVLRVVQFDDVREMIRVVKARRAAPAVVSSPA